MSILLLGLEVFPVALMLTLTLTALILPCLIRAHAGQRILEIGPAWHKTKEGTPTMGGIAPITAITLTTVLFALFLKQRTNESVAPWLFTLLFALANASVGILDDLTKLRLAQNRGLSPMQKLILQSAIAAAYLALLRIWGICETVVQIPFTGKSLRMGWVWYPFFFLTIIWFVNCANLTDGIDGLAASVNAGIGIFYFIYAARAESRNLMLCASALMGGALGFFAYNRNPARIFMGDTGSLFFGGMVVGCAMISPSPLALFFVGIVFLMEGLSVVLQVVYFKLSHGKRLFKMAPLHHHFEKCGMSEWRIVLLFSLITALFALIAWGSVAHGIRH